MKTTLLTFAILAILARAHAGDTRDANGKSTGTITKVPGGEIVRDANGRITERRDIQKSADGSKTVTIRDANGKIIGTERKN